MCDVGQSDEIYVREIQGNTAEDGTEDERHETKHGKGSTGEGSSEYMFCHTLHKYMVLVAIY